MKWVIKLSLAAPQVGARAAWTGRGTCVSLPFHITSGQLAVGQGVVVHAREETYLEYDDFLADRW
ncbi:unnamed protein product [Spirodela intermedia]|uniref:Uncharacterized protein n=1 Tax=Spirodela intermedia TaxID=51605 RepID=A0A7I8KVI2_SPIIN|nr:unnamed protein product [Spirodela intermedia]